MEVTLQYCFSYQIRKVGKKMKEKGRRQNLKPQINNHSKIQIPSYVLLARTLFASTLRRAIWQCISKMLKKIIFMTQISLVRIYEKTIKDVHSSLAIRVIFTSTLYKIKILKTNICLIVQCEISI